MGHRAPHRRSIARPISCAILRCSSKAARRRDTTPSPCFLRCALSCFADARDSVMQYRLFANLLGRPSVARFCLGAGRATDGRPCVCGACPLHVPKPISHAPARQILQNLFAFVIFLSHSFGILISVKGNPPRHQRMPPTTARLRWNRTGTCIAAFPLRFCMFAQTKRSHLCGCFSYFPPKKKAVYAAFFIFLMNLKNRPLRRSVFMHFFA